LAALGGLLLYQGARALRAAPQAALISGVSLAIGLLCFYELLRSDSITRRPDAPGPRRRVPWDVLLVSYLVLVACVLDGIEMLGLVFSGIPEAVIAGNLEQLAAALIVIGRYVTSVCAAVQLRALRPWARLWLALLALVSVVLMPSADEIVEHLGALSRGGMESFSAARWLARYVFPLVTLVVLARPRDDFPPLAPRARRAVFAAVGVLLVFGRVQAWWRERPSWERPPRPLAPQSPRIVAPDPSIRAATPRGEVTIKLRLLFHGRPFADVVPERLSLVLQAYEVTTVKGGPSGTTQAYVPQGTFEGPRTFRDGLIEVGPVPDGYYDARVTVHRGSASGGEPTPGDLVGRGTYVGDGGSSATTIGVPLMEVMHLEAPQHRARLASPVTITWRAVAGASRYEAILVPMFNVDDADFGEISATVTEPRWVISVPPGEWMLSVSAFVNEGEEVGILLGEPKFVVEAAHP
jgi:hypothetical protein